VLDQLRDRGYEILLLSHAAAILGEDFPAAIDELEHCLVEFDIPITEIIGSGGGETKGTQRLRHALTERGWKKTVFEIKKTINGIERESISHEVDHVRHFDNGTVVALEIEWNNKDPFFDRDLENFKRLHAEGAISVGIIVTRGTSLQDDMRELVTRFVQERNIQSYDDLKAIGLEPTAKQIKAVTKVVNRAKNPLSFQDAWVRNFVSNKFGAAQTHWRKLMDRVDRGVGNPCPLLLIGMPSSIVTFNPEATIEMLEDMVDGDED
jgi:hypothetical protein